MGIGISKMISYKHNCIFVHIPRTGGTSIENIIWPSKKDRVEDNLSMGFVQPFYNKYQTEYVYDD